MDCEHYTRVVRTSSILSLFSGPTQLLWDFCYCSREDEPVLRSAGCNTFRCEHRRSLRHRPRQGAAKRHAVEFPAHLLLLKWPSMLRALHKSFKLATPRGVRAAHQWQWMQKQGHIINPCNSEHHPAVREGLKPSGAQLAVQEAYTPESICWGCGQYCRFLRCWDLSDVFETHQSDT